VFRQERKSDDRRSFRSHDSGASSASTAPLKSSFSWLKKIFAVAPIILFRKDDEEGAPNSKSHRDDINKSARALLTEAQERTRVSIAEESPQKQSQRRFFTGTGRMMLGLGTLGVLAYTQPEAKNEPDVLRVIDSVRAMARSQSTAAPEEQMPFKRKLFQNLQEMFNLQPESSEERPSHAVPPAASKKPDSDKHVFEHLVVGDKLVLTERDITANQWKALSAFLSSCPHIKSLRLQGMEITAKEADDLGKGLNQIRNITFCDNSIGLHEGTLERLVALLLCCGLLESTSIIRNSLGDEHVSSVVALMQHSRMERLSLCWNGITDKGATQLATAVVRLNNSLQDVDVSYNLIGPDGVAQLQMATRKRLDAFKVPLSMQTKHNERFLDFKREYKEYATEVREPEPPWYLRRSIFGKESYSKPFKRSRK